MKRRFILFLVALLCISVFFVLAACGENDVDTDNVSDETNTSESSVDEETPQSFSEEEAEEYALSSADEHMFFVKTGDAFVPLTVAREVTDSVSWNEIDAQNSVFPVLDKGSQLVYFSEESPAEFYDAFPIKKEGYTVNIWKNSSDEISCDLNGIEESTNESESLKYDSQNQDNAIESINDEDPLDFFNANEVDVKDYCTNEFDTQWDPACKGSLLDLNMDDSLTVAYHEGTEYKAISVEANLEYYIIDGCLRRDDNGDKDAWYESEKLKTSLSDNSFAVLDTSNLKPGKYLEKTGAFLPRAYWGFEVK